MLTVLRPSELSSILEGHLGGSNAPRVERYLQQKYLARCASKIALGEYVACAGSTSVPFAVCIFLVGRIEELRTRRLAGKQGAPQILARNVSNQL